MTFEEREAGVIIRGRQFSRLDLTLVKKCVNKYFELGRTRISEEICKALDWRQPNGWLKDRACRDALRILADKNIIVLPAPLIGGARRSKDSKPVQKRLSFSPEDRMYGDLTLIWAKGNAREREWNGLVEKYHYLGHKVVVGRCVKYLVMFRGEIVSAIAFSSPAWDVEARDAILFSLGIDEVRKRDLVINNSRYLIVPGEKIPNLASRILAITASQIVEDWECFYSIRPKVIETFVEPSRFEGTCYKAANWVKVGMTKGYKKTGSFHSNGQESKFVFLYGLTKNIRKRLSLIAKKGVLCE